MKKKIFSLLFFGAVLLFSILLVIFSMPAQDAAKSGMDICISVIIPSLFPFFVLSSLIISTGASAGLCRLFSRAMPFLFGVSGAGALPLILGFVGGYPIGAKTVAQLYISGNIDKKEANRLLIFTSNTGPAFILGAAGTAVFRSLSAGVILYLSHIISALIIGLICRIMLGDVSCVTPPAPVNRQDIKLSIAFTKSVTGAFVSILNVCAFVIIFSVFTSFFIQVGGMSLLSALLGHFGADPVKFRPVITGFFEISSGIAALSDISSDLTFALPAASFILGWGGFSVHFQALSFISEADLSAAPYMLSKLIHGILAAFITCIFVALSGIQPVFSFVGHETVKSFIFDYIGLFYSVACAIAGFTIMLISKRKS